MGFLDESKNKEQAVNLEKIEKIIQQMQSNMNLKINQQSQEIAELTKKIEFMQTHQVTAFDISSMSVEEKAAIAENNTWLFVIGVFLSLLMVICTIWLDWNTVEEDKDHTVQKIIEQNYVDTQNVWWQNETMMYNQQNGTYLTVGEHQKMRQEQQKAQ